MSALMHNDELQTCPFGTARVNLSALLVTYSQITLITHAEILNQPAGNMC